MTSLLFSEATVSVGDSLVHIGFTSCEAGNLGLHVGDQPLRTLQNRRDLEDALGLQPGSFVYMNQVHGTEVFDPDSEEAKTPSQSITTFDAQRIAQEAPVADAMVTSRKRPLAVMVADCIPVVLVGETAQQKPILAVAHAGRRGLLDGVIQQTVGEMLYRGAVKIQVWLGPSICGRCYEVPVQMQRESVEQIPQISSQTSWGTPALDLPAAAKALLEQMPQVTQVHTELATCTFEDSTVFSHRRGEPQGRIAGLVWTE